MDQKPFVGVWLDHRKAILFWTNAEAEIDIVNVESNYQEENEPTDSLGMPDDTIHGGAVAHASVDHRRQEQLKQYYKKLDKMLRPARQIYLFGPGQAKKELASVLEKDKALSADIRGIQGADKKLTVPQMAAHVREEFGLPK